MLSKIHALWHRPFLMKTVVAVFSLVIFPVVVHAERIAIIGTGDVAGALGPEFAALGHDIVYGSRSPEREDVVALVERTGKDATAQKPADAVLDADIVVLAVPGLLVEEITLSLGDLSGKIIIDPTNPLQSIDGGGFILEVENSNAEVIQAAAPDAFVVKAFNTLYYQQMVDPDSSGGPISIPLVGNSDDAKTAVAKLVEGMGLEPIDVGPLENARYVEGMLLIWINNWASGRQLYEYHLRKVSSR